MTLEIHRADGRLVRRYSSDDPVTPIPDAKSAPVPVYWYRPPQALSDCGRHAPLHVGRALPADSPVPPEAGAGGLPIQGIPHNSPAGTTTPWVSPGTYTVTLTTGGKSYSQPITVKQDPRVQTPAAVMQQVYALTDAMYFGAVAAQAAAAELSALREQASKIQAQGPAAQALAAFVQKATALEGLRPAAGVGGGRGALGGGRGEAAAPAAPNSLWAVSTLLAGQMNAMQAADVAPTANTLAAVTAALDAAEAVMARWASLQSADLPALNATLKAAGLPGIGGRPDLHAPGG